MGSKLNCMSAATASPHRHRPVSKPKADHRERVKVLFLDVDGVLNGEHYGYMGVDDGLLLLLKSIIDSTHCKIVLSSTWRLHKNARLALLHFMKTRANINVQDIVIGDTPSIKNTNRAHEIESFLESEQFETKYIASSWCAIDDLALDEQSHFMDMHFVRTNFRTGITPKNAMAVVQILNSADSISNSYDY